MPLITLVIHGGAGTILKKEMTAEQEALYTEALNSSLDAGYKILESGGSAIDAVTAATVAMEDHILFNAGRGSVFTRTGKHEMDAAIMDGKTLEAGAVAGIDSVKNPVLLARKIMEEGSHVLLSGDGAMEFAKQHNIAMENDQYFFSQQRYDQWQSCVDTGKVMMDHTIEDRHAKNSDKKFGTVGAAACDRHGNIAAATSTGGMTNKRPGRIGDSPLIGAGNYANNKTCAISCTGHGELFIRAVAAYDVSCLMEYAGLSLQQAMARVVMDKLVKIGGEGGMIGVDASGNHAMLFNSEGMYRGVKNSAGLRKVKIYRDED
jgi:beta-aspartyl-peptidase (threonine type)